MIALMVGLFSSCDKEYIINVNVPGCGVDSAYVEYARCYFTASNSDVEMSVTKSAEFDNQRVIKCYFPEAKGDKEFSVLEGESFSVEIPRFATSKAYFVYADGQHLDTHTKLEANSENIFDGQWEGIPTESTQSIKLSRSVGKVTVIKGNIPSGFSISLKKGDGINYFDWAKLQYTGLCTVKHYTPNIEVDSYYSFPTSNKEASVDLQLLDKNGKTVLSKTVDFAIKRNVNVNITVNASTHGNGGFNVTIDDTPMVDEDINVDM